MTGIAIARFKTIDPRNNYLARQRLLYWEGALAQYLPWIGRDDITVRFSLEASGYTDEGVVSTISGLGPFSMVEATGEAGVYYYDVASLALRDALSDLVGTVIYQIVEGGAQASGTFALCDSLPLMVSSPRYPT